MRNFKSVLIAGAVSLILVLQAGESRGADWEAMTSGTTKYIAGIWGASANNVFAVGDGGTILHYDGSAWSAMTSGTTHYLGGIWGASANDVFAVGSYGTILRYNGAAWSAMTSGTANNLMGIWGTSSNDVFAVGLSGTILHYDGVSWSLMDPGPDVTAGSSTILGVWGSSSNSVFALAYWWEVVDGLSPTYHYLILHYDGSAWTTVDSGLNNILSGIWGASSSDIYAVGGGGSRHFDGSVWHRTFPVSREPKVRGTSPSDVFVAGDGGGISHFDGSTWSSMTSQTIQYVGGIWGSSSTDVFIVGSDGTILRRKCSASAPDQFAFPDRTGAALNRQVATAGIQVSGICTATSISVTGGEYSINGGGYTSLPGTVGNGRTVGVRMISSEAAPRRRQSPR